MRPLLAPPLLLLALRAFAGTVVEIAPLEVRPGGGPKVQAVSPSLQLAPASLVPGLQTALLPSLAAPSAPAPATPAKAIVALRGGASKLVEQKGGEHAALRETFDAGTTASKDESAVAGAEAAPAALSPSKPSERSSRKAPPRPGRRLSPSRFPLVRGEIGWREAWRLLNPASDANTKKFVYYKNAKVHAEEAAMHRHNIGYVLGFRAEDWETADRAARAQERARILAERGARVRGFYGLPDFGSLSPPVVALGQKLGQGGQGAAYRDATRPGRAIKVFTGAGGRQLQEMAAILDAVADQGFAVERVKVVALPDGTHALEMREFTREDGWVELATFYRVNRGSAEAREAERKAEKILFAVERETEKALGFKAADWKTGLMGEVSDDHLENFVYNRQTGEVIGFDTLVKW